MRRFLRVALLVATGGLLLLAGPLPAAPSPGVPTTGAESAAEPGPEPESAVRRKPGLQTKPLYWRVLMPDLDRALSRGDISGAEALLARLDALGAPQGQLVGRRIRLARLRGDEQQAVDLSRRGLLASPASIKLRRELARSLIALERVEEAADVLDELIAMSSDRRPAVTSAVRQWREAGFPERALALCDRERLEHPPADHLDRQRAACLIELDRIEEGAVVLAGELAIRPLNLPLVRGELSRVLRDPDRIGRAADALDAVPDQAAAVRLLRADLALRLGDADRAEAAVAPLVADPRAAIFLLENVSVALREAPLIESPEARAATVRWLLAMLEGLADGGGLTPGRVPRTLDLLARAAVMALDLDFPGDDPEAAVDRLERALERVRLGNPGSGHLYTAQIALARYDREVLRRPERAAKRLQRLLTDLDLPIEGVALARLAWGECRLAAGDTAGARRSLAELAADPDHRDAAGVAHFILGRLDLAQGHWDGARDRFASVALDAPDSDVANDALDLGLLAAEALDGGVARPLMDLYSRSVGFALTADPESRRAVLAEMVGTEHSAAGEAADGGSNPLIERGLYELAGLLGDAGDIAGALVQCDRIVRDHPAGSYAAPALALEGELLQRAGRPAEARTSWERLLLQYPDYIFADEIRDHLRSLP